MAFGAAIVVSFIGITAVFTKQAQVAIMAIGVLGGIITWYTHTETKNPSVKK